MKNPNKWVTYKPSKAANTECASLFHNARKLANQIVRYMSLIILFYLKFFSPGFVLRRLSYLHPLDLFLAMLLTNCKLDLISS